MANQLTKAEVARRAEASEARVTELVELGIIAPRSGDLPFGEGDVTRIRLVDELEANGVPPTQVAAAIKQGDLSLSYLDRLPGPTPRSNRTYGELCQAQGLSFEQLCRVFEGFGLARPQPTEHVREDDLAIIDGLPILTEAGLGEAEILRAARVWGEGARRVAQHQVHSFHELIEEPFRRMGMTDDQALDAALTKIGVRLIPFCGQLLAWLWRRHFEAFSTEHRVGHIETALDAAGIHRRPAQHQDACVFADLSGYTSLTDARGDTAAADMALRLGELVQDVASDHGGRVVKLIGDAVHFIFHDPASAVLGSLDLVDRTADQGLPPAHVGANAGPMTYIDGDYYGLAVIVAARIAEQAGPGQVLVGESMATDGGPKGVRFEDAGSLTLKGLGRRVRTFRAMRA